MVPEADMLMAPSSDLLHCQFVLPGAADHDIPLECEVEQGGLL